MAAIRAAHTSPVALDDAAVLAAVSVLARRRQRARVRRPAGAARRLGGRTVGATRVMVCRGRHRVRVVAPAAHPRRSRVRGGAAAQPAHRRAARRGLASRSACAPSARSTSRAGGCSSSSRPIALGCGAASGSAAPPRCVLRTLAQSDASSCCTPGREHGTRVGAAAAQSRRRARCPCAAAAVADGGAVAGVRAGADRRAGGVSGMAALEPAECARARVVAARRAGNEGMANASSLHSFYRARLTRAYLAIGNPQRGLVGRGHGLAAAMCATSPRW